MAFVDVMWTHLTGDPTKGTWSTSVSRKVFTLARPVQSSSVRLPISLVRDEAPSSTATASGGPGIGSPAPAATTSSSVALTVRAPEPTTVRVTVEDDGGQSVERTVLVPATYPVAAYLRDPLIPRSGDSGAVRGEVAEVLDSVRELLQGGQAEFLSEALDSGLADAPLDALRLMPHAEALEMFAGPDGLEEDGVIPDGELILVQPAEAALRLAPSKLQTGPVELFSTPEPTEDPEVQVLGLVEFSRPD